MSPETRDECVAGEVETQGSKVPPGILEPEMRGNRAQLSSAEIVFPWLDSLGCLQVAASLEGTKARSGQCYWLDVVLFAFFVTAPQSAFRAEGYLFDEEQSSCGQLR